MKLRLRYVLLLVIVLVAGALLVRKETHQAVPETKLEAKKDAATTATEKPESKETPLPFTMACKYLSDALAKCEPYSCDMPHPAVKGFTVKHTITGALPNGLCVHLQTAPGDMLVVCNYSQPMRLLVAKNMRIENHEKMSPEEEKIMSAGFDAECEVVNEKTGEVIKRTLGGERLQNSTEEKKQDDGTAKDLP